MYYKSLITRCGQTILPKILREKYELKEGDEVIYFDLDTKIILLFKPKDPITALKNIKVDSEKTVEEIKREALEAATRAAICG